MSYVQRLMNAVPVVCAVFARSAGLTLHFYEGVPKTDGKNVWLPHMPFDASPKLIKRMLRAIAHEVGGHVKNTDFSAFEAYAKAKGAVAAALVNAVEDPRIERLGMTHRPGTRVWLNEGLDVYHEDDTILKSANAADALLLYVLLNGWTANGMTSEVMKRYPKVREDLVGFIGESGVNRLDGLLANAWSTMASTSDAIDTADDILALLKKIEKEQKKEQQAQQQQQQQNAKPDPNAQPNGSGQGQSGQAPQGAQPQNGQGAGQPDPNAPQGAQGQQSPSTGAGQILGSQPTIVHLDQKAGEQLAQMAKKEVQAAQANQAKSGAGGAGPKMTTKDFDRGATLSGAPCFAQKDVTRLNKLRAMVSTSVARLIERMEEKVTELRQEAQELGKRGRLHVARMTRGLMGDPNIFRKKMVQEWRELALSIVVDCSPSMRGTREESASSGLIAMAMACERLDIPFEVCAFGNPVVQYIKNFDEPLREAMPKFGALNKALNGSTPMAEGVLAAAVNLSQRPEPRKVLFLVTDGEADNPQAVKQVVERIREEIEVIGLGIETRSVASLFPEHEIVSGTNEVGPALVRLVAKHLADVA